MILLSWVVQRLGSFQPPEVSGKTSFGSCLVGLISAGAQITDE